MGGEPHALVGVIKKRWTEKLHHISQRHKKETGSLSGTLGRKRVICEKSGSQVWAISVCVELISHWSRGWEPHDWNHYRKAVLSQVKPYCTWPGKIQLPRPDVSAIGDPKDSHPKPPIAEKLTTRGNNTKKEDLKDAYSFKAIKKREETLADMKKTSFLKNRKSWQRAK